MSARGLGTIAYRRVRNALESAPPIGSIDEMTIAVDKNPPPRVGLVFALARRPAARRALGVVAVVAAALIWTFLLRLPVWRIDGPDDAFYAEVAHLWTRGALPYVAAFDVKPPGLFALLAVAQLWLGPDLDALRAVAVLCDAVAAAGVFFLGRRFGSTALGVFAATLYPFLSEVVAGNDAYPPLAALTTLAFLAALSRLPILKRAALAGLAIGAAGAVKQTAAFEAVALLAVLTRAPDAAPRRIRIAAAFVAAAAAAPLGFLIYFAWHDAAGALIADTVLNALRRPASDGEGLSFAAGLMRFLPLQRAVMPIFGFACLALLRRGALARAAPSLAVDAAALWFALASLAIVIERSIGENYLAPTLAPGLLLTGALVVFAPPALAGIAPAVRLAMVGLAAVAAALFIRVGEIRAGEARAPQETRAIAAAAAAIRARGPAPTDRLYVVNRSGWLYPATGLAPPTAYFFPGHTLCEFPGAGRARLVEALATGPRYVVVADRRIGGYCDLAANWLVVADVLARSYRPLAHVTGEADFYDVYEAVGGAARAPNPG
jgi:hypothetical protein